MTRKKVNLAFIANDSARKATFKKRKKGMMKKAHELTTLCGVDACVIVYSPYDPQPEVWPSPMGVQRVLKRFESMPELEQRKKMVSHEGFMRQRIMKANEQVRKMKKENREKEMAQMMFQYVGAGQVLHNMSVGDLNDLTWLIEQNLRDINRRLEVMNKMTQNKSQSEVAEKGKGVLQMNMANVQKQEMFVRMMNNGGDDIVPFGDVNHQNVFWPDSVFP